MAWFQFTVAGYKTQFAKKKAKPGPLAPLECTTVVIKWPKFQQSLL